MAFENLKKTGIKYVLTKLKDVFLQIKDAVKSVNGETADENGNIQVNVVPFAQNLESEVSQSNYGTFIARTAGGESSIENGDAWLMKIQGNYDHSGYVAESLEMTVTPMPREEGVDPITATIDRATFVAFVEESGTTTLTYSTEWSADPTLYGVTVTGTPIAGDVITIVYVKEERGTITQSDPQSLISTGWNLYSHTSGYARVLNYSNTYGFRAEGTYTKLEFSATLSGTRTEITDTDGNFDVPSDGYVWVTGGNSTDTAIYMTWSDWTEEANGGTFEGYESTSVDLSSVMSTYFPYGLLAVADVRDEIDLNIGLAINRVDRLTYNSENLATAISSGRAYEYDEDYIYLAKASAVSHSVIVDGSYKANDHGLEMFTGTDVAVITQILYGNNLKNKLERDVVQISSQTLSDSQKTQARTNIGAASAADLSALSDQITTKTAGTVTPTQDTDSTKNDTDIYKIYNTVFANLVFYPTATSAGWLTVGTITSAFRPSGNVYLAFSGQDGSACGGIITAGGNVRLMKPNANTYYYGSVVYVKS